MMKGRLIFSIALVMFQGVLLTQPCKGQVSIKERVTIMPGVRAWARNSIMSTGDKFIVAPRNGTLRLLPDLIFKCQALTQPQIPTGHHLDITIRDTTYQVPLDTGGFVYGSGDYFPKWDQCLNTFVQFKYIQKASLRPSFSRGVLAGDTIRFVYHAEFSNPTGSVTESYPTEAWYRWVDMWSLDPCVNDTTWMREWLHLKVSYEDTIVTFTHLDSNNVFPTWLWKNGASRNNSTDKKNYMDMEARTTFRDSAIANTSIRLSKPILVDSGGHSHDGNRPMGRYRLNRLGQSGYDTLDTFVRATDSTGSLKFRFIASEFGGVERVKASLASDSTKLDTVSLVTKVKHLSDFAQVDVPYWRLTGNTGTTTYGPCYGVLIRHYSNHWFDSTYVDSLGLALVHFWTFSGKQQGGGHYLLLGVNDMSLHDGGLFDICSNWIPGHVSHRIGTSVDIDSTNAELANGGGYVSLSGYQVDILTSYMLDYGGTREKESSIHYEFKKRKK